MTLLAGAFLAGLVALAVPLWLHRLNERSPAETTVSSLMLMREAEEPVRTRRALAHRVLLAMRLALLAVLTVAFAQPVLETVTGYLAEERAAPANLVVLDGSLSMRRDGVWTTALGVARDLVDDPAAAGSRMLLAGDRLLSMPTLTDASPGWSRLDFAGLPSRIEAALAAWPEPPGGWLIHLVSDFQASAAPERFNALVEGTQWPVILHAVGGEEPNWAVTANVLRQEEASDSMPGSRIEVMVSSFDDEPRNLAVLLRRAGAEVGRVNVAVPGGGRAATAFDIPPSPREAVVWEVLIDADDALPEDDVARVVQAAQDARRVAVLALNADPGALRFLVAALDASGVPAPIVLGEDSVWPQTVDVLIALDPGQWPASVRLRVQRHVDNGGGVLMIVGPRAQREGALPLVGALTASVFDMDRQVLVADTAHPLAQGGWADVTVARALASPTPGLQTILSLVPMASDERETGLVPLLAEKRLGKGRMLVLLTALDRGWSSLVLRPAFVGLIGNAVAYLAGDFVPTAFAGEALPISATSLQLFDADGQRVLALNETVGVSGGVVQVSRPGVYTVRTPGRETLMAVNTDPRESDLRPMAGELLVRWQDAASRTQRAQPSEDASQALPTVVDQVARLPLAPWLLTFAIALLVAESVAANVGRIGLGVLRRRDA